MLEANGEEAVRQTEKKPGDPLYVLLPEDPPRLTIIKHRALSRPEEGGETLELQA
ncbi:MAG: hypothetical protein ACOC3I_02800 [Verrucomicrobiota bacterium]